MNPKLRNILLGIVAFAGGYMLANGFEFSTTPLGLVLGVAAIFGVTFLFTRRK